MERKFQRETDSAEMVDLVNSTDKQVENAWTFFDKSEWLTTKEAAIVLRKFKPDGSLSTNAIYKMEAKGVIKGRKFDGRLYFRRREIDYQIETSVR